jgi:hypothetical protein
MGTKAGSTGWKLWLGLLLVGTLAVAPAAWASGEEIREQDAEKKAEAKKDEKAEQASGRTETDAATAQKAKTGQPVVHPTFNTVEEIRAYQDSAGALWSCRVEPAPVVTWREIDPQPAPR